LPDKSAKSPPLGRRLLLGYSLGSLGTGVYSTVPGVLLLYYMTDFLGVASALGAIVLFFPKIWGILTDPLIGRLSDRTRSRFGRRRPWLLAGAIGVGLSFILLFRAPVSADPMVGFWYVLVLYGVSAAAYSLFAVPYIAMPAEMSEDPAERSRVMAWRMTFVMAGVMVGAGFAPILVSRFGGGHAGFGAMSLIVGAFCAAAMFATFLATRNAPSRVAAIHDASFGAELLSVWGDRLFRSLMLAYLLQAVAAAIGSALLPYTVTRILNRDPAMIGTMGVATLCAGMLAMPLWHHLSVRLGKRAVFAGAAAWKAFVVMLWIFAGPGLPIWAAHLLAVGAGIGFAGLQLIPFSMVTDVIHHDARRNGRAREGMYTGVWTSCEKAGLAIGPLFAAAVLALGGYVASKNGATTPQTPTALLAIRLGVSVLPAALLLLSLVAMRRFDLAEGDVGSRRPQAEGAEPQRG
jgi:Na+/melibiose symporter-like transporter